MTVERLEAVLKAMEGVLRQGHQITDKLDAAIETDTSAGRPRNSLVPKANLTHYRSVH
jgi:hypothetical protein